MEEEFSVFDAWVEARQKAGLTQEEVAKRMGTKPPAIARLESSGGQKKPTPTLSTLQKYARPWGADWNFGWSQRKKNMPQLEANALIIA